MIFGCNFEVAADFFFIRVRSVDDDMSVISASYGNPIRLCSCKGWTLNRSPAGEHCRVFPEVVGECYETEPDLHFPVRLETEPLEAVVELDVTEHCLRFNRASTPVHQTPFARQEFSRLTFK